MRRTFAAILLLAVLAVGAGAIANTAYQAGLSTAVTTAVSDGATVVAPPYAYGYGYGFHPFGFGGGFSIFGFFGTLFVLFIVFGLIRALVWGGRHHGRGGPGGWGPGWDRDARREHFANQFRGTFEAWHQQSHTGDAGNSTTSGTGQSGTGGPNPPTSNPPTSTPPAG